MLSSAQLSCSVGLGITFLIIVGMLLGAYVKARASSTTSTNYSAPTVYRNRKDWE